MVQRLVSISGDPSAPFIFSSDELAVIPLERCPESNQIPATNCDPCFSSGSFLRAGPWPRVLKKECEWRQGWRRHHSVERLSLAPKSEDIRTGVKVGICELVKSPLVIALQTYSGVAPGHRAPETFFPPVSCLSSSFAKKGKKPNPLRLL